MRFRAAILAALCLAVGSRPCAADEPPLAAAAAGMASAAKAFLAALSPADAAKAKLSFETGERRNWHFVPRRRAGVPLKAMSPAARKAALALLSAGLSEKGFSKVETIRSLETVLAGIEGSVFSVRDPGLYYLTVFGEPSEGGTWGWRYEGHHLSLNWTVVGGRAIASSPQFLGANPATVRDGPMKGTRALGAEEDLARALVDALRGDQRRIAIVSPSPPSDILTGASRRASTQGNGGLAWKAMAEDQRGLLLRLVEEHAGAQRPEVAAARLGRVRAAGLSGVRFAWMGGIEKGQRHYYRIQGPTFLVEYDNTQDDANHIHSVWRDFDGDFGEDLLAEHYGGSPHSRK